LLAPVNGTVQNVKIHTPCAVVTAADTLMTIVPDDAGIEIENSRITVTVHSIDAGS
jgi:hemolysin D